MDSRKDGKEVRFGHKVVGLTESEMTWSKQVQVCRGWKVQGKAEDEGPTQLFISVNQTGNRSEATTVPVSASRVLPCFNVSLT